MKQVIQLTIITHSLIEPFFHPLKNARPNKLMGFSNMCKFAHVKKFKVVSVY